MESHTCYKNTATQIQIPEIRASEGKANDSLITYILTPTQIQRLQLVAAACNGLHPKKAIDENKKLDIYKIKKQWPASTGIATRPYLQGFVRCSFNTPTEIQRFQVFAKAGQVSEGSVTEGRAPADVQRSEVGAPVC